MATIKTPAAGVSPYEVTAADPTILRASADGSTKILTSTGVSTSAIINGQEALNQIINTGRSGVFEGANVTINLEEQNFSTTNQVTSNTNYPAGNIGEIQFNSGSNSFASDVNFTYADSNVFTPGIRTDGYFYSNGAPFLAGGNAAIGNFVFTGDNMTISDANSTLSVTGNGTGNVNISANSKTWTFSNDSNLTFPDNSGASWPINKQRFGMGNIGAWLDGQWTIGEFSGNGVSGTVGIRIDPAIEGNTGITIPSQADSTTQPVQIYNTGGGGISLYNGANNWSFNNNGTTQFPGNLLQPPEGNPLDIKVTIGNAYSTVSLYDVGSQLIIQDNTTGPNPAWALFEADLANVNTPQAVVILKPGDTGNEVRWTFNAGGNITFPYQPTNNRTGSGNALVFAKSNYQKVIATAPGDVDQPTVSRLVIAGGDGFESGEGGDIYLWAGRSGTGVAGGQGGGDIKVDAGDALNSAQGGTVKIRGGNSYDQGIGGGLGGFVEIYAGGGNIGAPVDILAGQGNSQANSGNVTIATPYGGSWRFDNYGNLTTPGSSGNITGANVISANVFTAPANVTISADGNSWVFGLGGNLTFPTGMHIDDEGANTRISQNEGFLKMTAGGNASYTVGWSENENPNSGQIAIINAYGLTSGDVGNLWITTGNQVATLYHWKFDNSGNLRFPTGSILGGTEDGTTLTVENPPTTIVISGADFTSVNTTYTRDLGQPIPTWYPAGYTPGVDPYISFNNFYGIYSPGFVPPIYQNYGPFTQPFTQWDNNPPLGTIPPTGVYTGVGNFNWTFGADGNLTLPNGAVIKDNTGNSVAFGKTAGNTGQGISSVAIGYGAGLTNQGNQSVAIGENAGANQGSTAVAIGQNAGGGVALQGDDAVAIGHSAGEEDQGTQAIAIGLYTGQFAQGLNSVAIGALAGQSAQGNNSIIINATGAGLNALTANTFTVAPVRNDVANIGNVMFYNATSNEITYGNTISVAGNITGAYFFGNGSQLTDVGAATVPSQNILPTIQTITATPMLVGYLGGGQGGVTVTVANTIPVTEYGVIVTAGTNVQTYAPGDLGSIPGTGNITFTTGLSSPATFTVYAYVTSNAGTYYSNAVTGTSGLCLLAGTQIALSDGSHKAIEHITYTDKLLSWDFDRGCYAETTAMWIKHSETGSQYNLLTFSDGTTLRTFDQHRIFNKQAGAFTYPMTEATPIGTITVNEHGQEITLTNKQVIKDTIEYYNVITDYHMNLFSDSVLTSCRFNNIYPITDMKFVKDGRTLRTRAEFENVEDRFFHGLRLAEQTADIKTVEWYVDRLLATEVSIQSELAF